MSRILVFFGVYEAEKSFAAASLDRLLDALRDHDLSVAVQDDASPSHVGQQLVDALGGRVLMRLIRLERSLGYHGTYERAMSFLERAAGWGEEYDWLLRADADLHLCSSRVTELFTSQRTPTVGMVGPAITMRARDYALYLADLLPAGLRRRVRHGLMEHTWELRRVGPVWWQDIGRLALRRGFVGRMIPGVFQAIGWKSVMSMAEKGWTSRPRSSTGLVFQDDLILTAMVQALGHPVIDIADVVPDFRYELFMQPGTPVDEIRSRRLDLVHPLKDSAWAHDVRRQLR